MRLVLAIMLAAMLASPALANSWIFQQSGDAHPTGIFSGPSAPVAGVNVPAGASIAPFTPSGGDTYPGDYSITDGVAAYTPPASPSPIIVPHPNYADVKAFELAIWADSNSVMTPAVKFMVAQNFPIMEGNATVLSNLQAGWAGAVAAFGGSWLTSDVQAEIVSVALANNIHLVP